MTQSAAAAVAAVGQCLHCGAGVPGALQVKPQIHALHSGYLFGVNKSIQGAVWIRTCTVVLRKFRHGLH
jgi:hypothetical protein